MSCRNATRNLDRPLATGGSGDPGGGVQPSSTPQALAASVEQALAASVEQALAASVEQALAA
jgi:hypothetical protein